MVNSSVVNISTKDDIMTAELLGEIDHHTARSMRESIDAALVVSRPILLNLNFKNVKFMDSSGIGLIMGRFKLVSSLGGKLKVINIPKRFERIIKLSGLGVLGVLEKV
ncbi:MAG: anti-sigma factor antagonist [Oscillospiraceae bacterium]|nr:anti-sigma factor antagonist [Oscillospiraceae bacterium]